MLLIFRINSLECFMRSMREEVNLLRKRRRKRKINSLSMDLGLRREMLGLLNLAKILIEVLASRLSKVYKK